MVYLWCSVFILLLAAAAAMDTNDGTVLWPLGTYALLKPKAGCPEEWKTRSRQWHTKGFLFQDTVDDNASNNRSTILHIDGNVATSHVLRYFCVKTTDTPNSKQWEEGQYCIHRKANPNTWNGMKKGWIRMDDETTNNIDRNWLGIYFAHVSWNRIYRLFFYCQIKGSKKIPISLPITKPFYLLPYGSRDCQQVKWMVATSEWIKYHTRNDITKTGQTYGAVPYHEFGGINDKGITMYYCYYESCNYTLTDKKGVFQSPGFPGKYPVGQLCSWRIVVPDDHTLHFRFTHFSLSANDTLSYSKKSNGSFQLNNTFQGHLEQPFTFTVTSDVLFVFRTNEEGNSTGFRAEYTVFRASETTPSQPSTTRNAVHTTTVPTTVTKNKTNNGTTDTHNKSPVGGCAECDGSDTTVLAVIPLICLIVVMAIVIIILYRWRSKKKECEKCASIRYLNKDTMNPTYDNAGQIQILQRTSTATMNTTLGTDDNDGQMYQALSGDHCHQPEYEAPDYSKQNGINDPNNDSGYPEYHELEPMHNNVPDVVYDVLEGPDSDDGPSGDQMYQALDKETTHNPLYQSTNPAAFVTRNPMYVDSVA